MEISEALNKIIEFFSSIIEFAVGLVSGLFDLLELIPATVSMFMSGVNNLPDLLIPFAVSSIAIAVVLLVVGRQNNS